MQITLPEIGIQKRRWIIIHFYSTQSFKNEYIYECLSKYNQIKHITCIKKFKKLELEIPPQIRNLSHTLKELHWRNQLLVLGILNELNNNFLVGLNLEHLHNKAHERGGLAGASMSAAEVIELHGLVDQRLRREPEALLLPVSILIYFCTQDLLHQILRVRTPYALRKRIRTIRHEREIEGRNPKPQIWDFLLLCFSCADLFMLIFYINTWE